MHGDYSKHIKKKPNCATEEQSLVSSIVVLFCGTVTWLWKTHAQSSVHDQSQRCRCGACYQCLAHLAETGKIYKNGR